MATILAGSLHAAVVETRCRDGLTRSGRNHRQFSFPFRKGGQLGIRVQILGRDFRTFYRTRCSVGSSSSRDSSVRGGRNNDNRGLENFDAVEKFDSRRFSNSDGSNCDNPEGDTGFRVFPWQSDLMESTKTVGMLLGGVVLALGFGALRFSKPAFAENVVTPSTLSTPLKGEETKSWETEAEVNEKLEVVVPEGPAGAKEETGAEGEFEPPYGEGSDLSNDPAEVLLRSYLQLNPDDHKALQALLFLRLKKGEVNAAVPILKKLIELEPDNLEWKYIRAQADEFAGDLAQARQGFEEILQIRPLSARAWQGLAVVMHRTGEDDVALERLNEAVKTAVDSGQSKDSLNLRMLLGQLHTMHGDLDKAMELYKVVGEEDPQDYRPYLCQGLVYSLIGEEKEAEKYFRRYRKLCPKDLQQRGFLDELMLKAKSESKELSKRAKEEEEVKKKGKKLHKAMRQPLASGGVPKDNQGAR